ncbi:hypothetical protein [Schlesneria sp. DSM 10557]|uniref:hypothetical protein n=1 Tax=Schlesneria sp. DSM 10557 TaxID=3044399 RepID=UPI00359F7177
MKMPDRTHHCLLRDVFRVLAMPELPKTNGQHRTLEARNELTDGRLVTGQTAFGEFPIVHELITPPKSIPAITLNGFNGDCESGKNLKKGFLQMQSFA